VAGVSAGLLLVAGSALGLDSVSVKSVDRNVPSGEPGRTSATVKCPAGKHVTSGGVEVVGAGSQLELEVGSTLPKKHNTAWAGGGNNSSGASADMTVTALCAKGNFDYVTVKAKVHDGKAVRKVAKCPLGDRIIGGGVGAPGDHGVEVFLSEPRDGPDKGTKFDDAWGGGENSSQSKTTTMTVTAVCQKLPKRAVKRVIGGKQVLPDNTSDSAQVLCPTGMHVVGGGAHTAPHSPDSEVHSSFPIDGPDADSKPDDGWQADANNDDSGTTIKLRSVALCVS
jgi:hypothetical protein